MMEYDIIYRGKKCNKNAGLLRKCDLRFLSRLLSFAQLTVATWTIFHYRKYRYRGLP